MAISPSTSTGCGRSSSEAGRSVDDEDFSLKLGLPLADESVDEFAAKVATARSLGVDELVIGGLVPASTFETVLAGYAEVCGLT